MHHRRDDAIDAMKYWHMADIANITNHTHLGNMNCRCVTSAPIDGQVKVEIKKEPKFKRFEDIKVKFNVDTQPMMQGIKLHHGRVESSNGVKPWWDINNFNNLSPIYLTSDGSGVTFDKPKNKEKKMSEYKRADFKIGESIGGVNRWFVNRIGRAEWISEDGVLGFACDNQYYFPSRQQAEQALSEFLNESESKLVLRGYKDNKYGNVGDETGIVDLRGDKLFVGDTVELFNTSEGYINGSCGMKPIVEDESKQFVMGVKGQTFTRGISGNYLILKTGGYEDLKVGDEVCEIEVKKETNLCQELTMAQVEEKLGYKVKVVGND